MAEAPIQIGDRVINLQMPGVFVVTARRGRLIDIETDEGIAMTVLDSAVRRLDATPPPSSDG
jgi:hypothetical protein